MNKLAVDTVSLGKGEVSSQQEGMEWDGVQHCALGAASMWDRVWWGCEKGDASGGVRGEVSPLTLGTCWGKSQTAGALFNCCLLWCSRLIIQGLVVFLVASRLIGN